MSTANNAPSATIVGVARRTMGIALLLLVVVLWTASNFLGSVRLPPPSPGGLCSNLR